MNVKQPSKSMDQSLEKAKRSSASQDDIVEHYAEIDGQLILVYSITREIVYVPDPSNEGVMIPIVRRKVIYAIDKNGREYKGVCGCKVCGPVSTISLHLCSHCHGIICPKHTYTAGDSYYCKKGWCHFIGRLRRFHRFILSCLECVGLYSGEEAIPTDSESFPSDSDNNWVENEKEDGNG